MGLEIDGRQDPSDLRGGDPQLREVFGEQAVGPSGIRVRRDWSGPVGQRRHALGGEPFAPAAHGVHMPA
jgi:hypothetical protein